VTGRTVDRKRVRRYDASVRLLHLWSVGLLLAACGGKDVDLGTPSPGGDGGSAQGDGSTEGTCTDRDRDGYGEGCVAGDDCDDDDPDRHPDAREECDDIDNDCDGFTDEGVRTPCGDCNPSCSSTDSGDGEPFADEDGDVDGVGLNDDGDLVLDGSRVQLHDVWIANTDDSTVSRLDSNDAIETGRYATLNPEDPNIAGLVLDLPGLPEPCPAWTGPGHCPSRTAVDFDGNMWVANRAFDRQGTVTKIAANLRDCRDRGHGVEPPDGTIQTSSDVNGNGAIDWDCNGDGLGDDWNTVCPPGQDKEYWGPDDECIVLSAPVGTDGGLPRALALDVAGNAWAGLFNDNQFAQVSPSGTIMNTVDALGSPYGAIIDAEGILWANDRCCSGDKTGALIRIDTEVATPVAELIDVAGSGCYGRYGITLDLQGRVWVAADDGSTHGCADDGGDRALAWIYDPVTLLWTRADPGVDVQHGRPQGLAPDEDGNVWVALMDGWIVGMAEDGSLAGEIDVDPNAEGSADVYTIGVSTDENGRLWMGNRMANTAVRFDPDDLSLTTVPIGERPYTYSDYTGFVFRNVTNPTGHYGTTLTGCGGAKTTWVRVEWDATVPEGASLTLVARAGEDEAALPSQPVFGPWTESPAVLEDPPGPLAPNPATFLRLTFLFEASPEGLSPIMHRFSTLWKCEDVIP